MASFEEILEKACKDVEIPGAVLVGGSADGRFHYSTAFGVRSLKNPSPLKVDDAMWLASCSKLVTTVAAMQCVEKGTLKLDENVTGILPELKGRQILTGFTESGEPILKENTKAITLRHLLTHQSGIAYDVFDPLLMQYRAYQKRAIGMKAFRNLTVAEANDFPLLFSPGDSWAYSVGCDWAGEMVSRVNGGITLEEYIQNSIWDRLHVKDITFHPLTKPGVAERLADMSAREGGVTMFGTAQNPKGKLNWTEETVWALDTVHCHGGAGMYGSVKSYQKLLQSLCVSDGVVLKSETVDEMFRPQLTSAAKAQFATLRGFKEMNDVFGGVPQDVEMDWGIGGCVTLKGYEGRSAGTMSWGGYPNLFWWVDRKAGMNGMVGTQVIPTGDERVVRVNTEWAEYIYGKAGVQGKGKL